MRCAQDKCGQCYEVMCVDGAQRGMNHSRLERVSACKDAGHQAVVVQVTDSCPCVYPGNRASNSLWCCGDAMHFDLSYTVRTDAVDPALLRRRPRPLARARACALRRPLTRAARRGRRST